jgi:hypothetical protein
MLPLGFFIGACIFKYCQNVVILVSSVPPIESLKSKTTLKNLTNLLRVLLFKDSSDANAGTSEIKNFDDPKELRADMAAKLCAETALPETRLAIHSPRKGLLRNAAQTEEDFISLSFFDFQVAISHQ